MVSSVNSSGVIGKQKSEQLSAVPLCCHCYSAFTASESAVCNDGASGGGAVALWELQYYLQAWNFPGQQLDWSRP